MTHHQGLPPLPLGLHPLHVLGPGDLDVEDLLDGLLFDAGDELHEHIVPFLLVFLKGVALPISSQANAFF